MEATLTPTLPAAWPGLQADTGMASRLADRQERADEAARSIPHELAHQWGRALSGLPYSLPSTQVRSERIDHGQLCAITTRRVEIQSTLLDELTDTLREGDVDLLLREVLTECPCPHARNLAALIQARLFRELGESVLCTLAHAEVAEALKAMVLRSVHPTVRCLVTACREHYISTQSPRVAEARGLL
jgi:hypothetical protein